MSSTYGWRGCVAWDGPFATVSGQGQASGSWPQFTHFPARIKESILLLDRDGDGAISCDWSGAAARPKCGGGRRTAAETAERRRSARGPRHDRSAAPLGPPSVEQAIVCLSRRATVLLLCLSSMTRLPHVPRCGSLLPA